MNDEPETPDAVAEDRGLNVIATVATGMEEFNMGLLSAFKNGIEQSLRLVQQMSESEKSVAMTTLASLCGQVNVKVPKKRQLNKTQQKSKSSPGKSKTTEEPWGENDDGSDGRSPEKDFVAFVNEVNNITNRDSGTESKQSVAEPQSKRQHTNRSPAAAAQSILKVPSVQPRRSQRRKPPAAENINPQSKEEKGENGQLEEAGDEPVKPSPGNKKDPAHKLTPDKEKAFSCETCGKSFTTKYAFIVHERSHTGEKPYPCHICHKSFSCSNNRQRHIRETHEGLRPYTCSLCSQGFYKANKLEKHWTDVHHLSNDEVNQEKLKLSKPKPPVQATLKCDICDKVFKTRSNLKVHEAVHKEERQHKCPNCDKRFSFRTNLKRHMLLHTGVRPHKCDLCFKGFIEHKSLQLHMHKEHGLPDSELRIALKGSIKMPCPECDRVLASRASLHNHMLTHTGSKPHACPKCPRTFSMKSNLKRHLRIHSNEKPWECSTCGKKFTEKKSLEVHFRVHTGEKPYSCKVCGKRFAQAGTLQAHMPVHDKKPSIQCEHCGKSFLRMSHYKFHITKVTKPPRYKCTDCSRAFHRRADLTRHRLTHSGEKPFHCTLCPKQFSRRLYLKDHLNIHLGQRPYSCLYCPSNFAESSTRSKHMRRCPMRITSNKGSSGQVDTGAAVSKVHVSIVTSAQHQEEMVKHEVVQIQDGEVVNTVTLDQSGGGDTAASGGVALEKFVVTKEGQIISTMPTTINTNVGIEEMVVVHGGGDVHSRSGDGSGPLAITSGGHNVILTTPSTTEQHILTTPSTTDQHILTTPSTTDQHCVTGLDPVDVQIVTSCTQQEDTTSPAADNLVSLTNNSSLVSVEGYDQLVGGPTVVNLPVSGNIEDNNLLLSQVIPDLSTLPPSVSLATIKQLEVQTVETPAGGSTKHYILVLQHNPPSQ